MEETDVEDDAKEVLKEVYVQPVAPLEFHAGYRLASEDPAIFLMGVRMMEMAGYVAGCGLRFPFLFAHLPPVSAGQQLQVPVPKLLAVVLIMS